jgi:outer membrane protein insertion porin family
MNGVEGIMNRLITLLLVTLIIAGAILAARPAFAEGEEQLMITAIELRGNESVTDQEILAVMQGRAGDIFSLNTLSLDLAAIEDLGWFASEPEHILEPFEGGVKVIIVLVENPAFVGVSIEQTGPGIYPKAELALLFSCVPGETINNNDVAQGLQAIERRYRDDGYTAATISEINVGDDGIISISVNEGVISDIQVQGNTKTHTNVILREVNTKIGEVFNAVTFRRDLERIYNLQLFEDIQPTFQLDDNLQVVLVITVVEARTGQMGFGGGYSSNDGLLASISYSESNFRGLGQRLSGMGQFGGPNPDFNISFYNPVIDSQKTSFTIEGYMLSETDRIRTGENAEDVQRFTIERVGGTTGIVRPLSEYVSLALSLQVLNGSVTWEDENGNSLPEDQIPDVDTIEWINRGLIDGTTNSLTAKLAYDTRDFSFDPSMGTMASFQPTMIGQILGGDFDAFKYEFEFRYYFPLGSDQQNIEELSPTHDRSVNVLATRLFYGTSSGDLPLIERFKVGGQYSVRGTKETSQSGPEALIFNAEYRFPLGGNLGGAIFFDAGTAAELGSNLSLDNMLSTVGIGIRYRIAFFGIAPIRLDYGYDLDSGEGQIVFGFGQLF